MMRRLAWIFALALVSPPPLAAQDWPQLLGPERNGSYSGPALAANWPKEGPRVAWRRDVGAGFSGPAVAAGRLILFHRVGGEEIVECLQTTNGATIWKHAYATAYRDDFGFDDGPRAVPAIAGQRVFTYGADGRLHGLELATGKPLWSRDCQAEFAAAKGFFGRASSPLVVGDTVVVNVGGKAGSGLVAFDAASGKVKWQAVDDEPSYASPIVVREPGRTNLFACTRGRFVKLEAATGRVLWETAFRPPVHASVTGASPLWLDGHVFISAAYDLGARLYQLGAEPKLLWEGDDQLTLQYASAVRRGDHLFGLHGRHDFPGGTELRCVAWRTGQVAWRKEGLAGANLLLAQDQLLVLTENGQLIRVAATATGYRETGRAQILGRHTRAHPALAHGRLFARDPRQLVCVELQD